MPKYVSTRNIRNETTASKAIIQGLSEDGGLFVPYPLQYTINITELSTLSYQEIAIKILSYFFGELQVEAIHNCVYKAYDKRFLHEDIVPLVYRNKATFMELYHGPTSAFKDIALTILPHLLTTSYKLENRHDTIAILTATSGDTGKAALAGFCDVENTNVTVFYPIDGVSDVQKRQMVTSLGDNVDVCGVKGNFDDCQRMVKNAVTSPIIKETINNLNDVVLSSANSINIGRLIPQIVYYATSYAKMVNDQKIILGQKVNFSVPTGNFGDILAGYYAKLIGIPINKLICCSNDNHILTDFLQTGTYDTHRPFYQTTSPSMDILVSSNLERLLFIMSNYNDTYVKTLMDNLKNTGKYTITTALSEKIQKEFVGMWVNTEEASRTIKELYETERYLIDPHTSVAYKGYLKYVEETNDNTPTIVLSTASPFKFAKAVLNALTNEEEINDIIAMKTLFAYTKLPIPKNLQESINLPIRFNHEIEVEDGMAYIQKRLEDMHHVGD